MEGRCSWTYITVEHCAGLLNIALVLKAAIKLSKDKSLELVELYPAQARGTSTSAY